jgi:hypothetical protein
VRLVYADRADCREPREVFRFAQYRLHALRRSDDDLPVVRRGVSEGLVLQPVVPGREADVKTAT